MTICTGRLIASSSTSAPNASNRSTTTDGGSNGTPTSDFASLTATIMPSSRRQHEREKGSPQPRRTPTQQLTKHYYNGHPLYLFSGDQKPGDTNGEGVNAFGGLWYALSSAGNQIVGSAPNSGIGY